MVLSTVGSTSEVHYALSCTRPIHVLPLGLPRPMRNRPCSQGMTWGPYSGQMPSMPSWSLWKRRMQDLQRGYSHCRVERQSQTQPCQDVRRAECQTCSYSTFSPQQAALSPHTRRRRAFLPLGLRNSLRLNHSKK